MAEPLVELKAAADGKGQSSSPATVLPSDLYRRPSAVRCLGQHQRRLLGSRLLPTLPLPTPPGIPGKPATAPDAWWPARIRESAA